MDSGSSLNMTTDSDSITRTTTTGAPVRIHGYNGSSEEATVSGVNADGFRTALLNPGQMPSDLDIRCANDYASLGAIILTATGGAVLELNTEERDRLLNYVRGFNNIMTLTVQNKIYLADSTTIVSNSVPTESLFVNSNFIDYNFDPPTDYPVNTPSYHASVYKNGRVYYTNIDLQILGLILSGISYSSLRKGIAHGSIAGLHPSLTTRSLRNFESNYGRSPDVVQMGNFDSIPNQHAYERDDKPLTRLGEHLVNDTFYSDFNERQPRKMSIQGSISEESVIQSAKRVTKLPSWGGATAMNITVCKYTGVPVGMLLLPSTKPTDIIKYVLDCYKTLGCTTEVFSADSGIVRESNFRLFTPAALQLLLDHGIKHQRAMPHNHSIGTSQAESSVSYIRRLMRMAFAYAKTNKALKHLGFTEIDIERCWGEIFYWSIVLLFIRPAWHDSTITRYEAATGRRPFDYCPSFRAYLCGMRIQTSMFMVFMSVLRGMVSCQNLPQEQSASCTRLGRAYKSLLLSSISV